MKEKAKNSTSKQNNNTADTKKTETKPNTE
jgi:hypothetical protein